MLFIMVVVTGFVGFLKKFECQTEGLGKSCHAARQRLGRWLGAQNTNCERVKACVRIPRTHGKVQQKRLQFQGFYQTRDSLEAHQTVSLVHTLENSKTPTHT